MIERYDVPEVSAIWSDRARMTNWLEIELAAVEAWAALGVVPKDDARACRDRASFDVDAVIERERVTRHDVAAFVDVVAASIGPEGRWIHHGLTSSDVLDTGLAMQLRASADVLLADLERLLGAVRRRALEFRDTVCMGRSHGIHAEPTSFGHKLAVFAFQLDRDRARLRRARDAVSVGAISGVVGSYASVDPQVEQLVCERLGLAPAEASTQVIQRDRHAEFVAALAVCASTLDALVPRSGTSRGRRCARCRSRSPKGRRARARCRTAAPGGVGARERARARDPWPRGHVVRERRAVARARHCRTRRPRRIVFPDATGLLAFMLRDMTWVNSTGSSCSPRGCASSSTAEAGSRSARRCCWPWSRPAWRATMPTASCSEPPPPRGTRARASTTRSAKDPEVIARVDAAAVDVLFDPRRFLVNLGPVFDRLEALEVARRRSSHRARFAISTPARTACCWSRPTGSAPSM